MAVTQTSLEAFNSISFILNIRQNQILKAVEELEEATNMEIASYLNWSINRVTPRIFELRNKGMIKLKNKRNCSITKRLAYAWSKA